MSYPIDTTTWRSPNYGSRYDARISAVVVHSCEGTLPSPRSSSLPWLCNPASKVSAHYYVCRDATIFRLVDDVNAAWHAGVCVSAFSNLRSIGIECEHRSGQDWPTIQRNALAWLIQTLIPLYHIVPSAIETHGQIALPGPYDRKHDPTDWPHGDFLFFADSLYFDAPPHPLDTAYRVKAAVTAPVIIRSAPSKTAAIVGRLHAGDVWRGELVTGQLVTLAGFGSTNQWVRDSTMRCVWSGLLEKI